MHTTDEKPASQPHWVGGAANLTYNITLHDLFMAAALNGIIANDVSKHPCIQDNLDQAKQYADLAIQMRQKP